MPTPRPAVVLLALSLATLALAAAAKVDRSSWTIGDFWTYTTNTTITSGLNLTGTATSTVAGTQSTMIGGNSARAFHVVLSGSGTALGTVATQTGNGSVRGSWILTGEALIEPASLHSVYSLLDLSVNGTYGYGVVLPFTLRVQKTTTFQILQDRWQYPFPSADRAVLKSRRTSRRTSTVEAAAHSMRRARGSGCSHSR